jgi:hypothetical protein
MINNRSIPIKLIIFIGSTVGGVVSWLYLTFATIPWVDARFSPVERRLELIDQRTWEMNGRKDPPPLGSKPVHSTKEK